MVDLILAVRKQYLAAGANPLKHWTQIQDRLLAASRMEAETGPLVTLLARKLQLPALSKQASSILLMLSEAFEKDELAELVEEEIDFLIAKARAEAERRKEIKSSPLLDEL
ncbi:MAG TPA: hypothetical protein VLV83_11570 [Acidobacteriota bacterium]|nr:hypothetical protein [Acidobacteriota bacterium]